VSAYRCLNYADPFGLCKNKDGSERKCTVYFKGGDINHLSESTRRALVALAQAADMDLGLSATSNGEHCDPRHNGNVRPGCRSSPDPALAGHAVDISEVVVDGTRIDIGTAGIATSGDALRAANALAGRAMRMPEVASTIWPAGGTMSATFGGQRTAMPSFSVGGALWSAHQSHLHISFWTAGERP
jgi:hypothetical protein